jgi:myosin-9
MRPDVMAVLKSSRSAFVRELVGDDPVAVYRWALIRSVFRAMFAFRGGLKNRVGRRATSVDRLLPPNEPPGSLSRRASDSHLNAFLRGEFRDKIPEFCDTSMFATIVSRARKTPIRQQSERQSYLRSLQAVKEITGGRPLTSTAKPTTVSKQFEYSLARLMKTLAQATPYFIRWANGQGMGNEKEGGHFENSHASQMHQVQQ